MRVRRSTAALLLAAALAAAPSAWARTPTAAEDLNLSLIHISPHR